MPSATSHPEQTQIKLDLWVNAISVFAFTPRHLTKIGAETQWDPSSRWCTDSPWTVGLTDKVMSPEQQDFTGASMTNSSLMVTSWPRVNEWSFHHPAETILWQTSMEAMQVSTKQWTWPECVYWPGMEADITDYIKWCLTCIECSNLPVEMLKPHEVPPRPWVKIGVDFFQDHLGKKHLIVADYFIKFLYMFPVASAHHFTTITPLRELFAAEGIPAVVMSDNGPPFNGEFRQFARDFDFVHTTSSPHFHQSNGFIEAMVKKVKNAYKKMDGSPNAQARALLQLCDTPITADLLSPAEILHGHPTQGAVLSRPSKRVNIHQIRKRLIELQVKQKQNFDKTHRAKDLHILKVKEQVQFFHNKQGTGPIKWTTGTVTEIFECGQSYMVQGPSGRVYRRNRAHLKPICHDSTSFQGHLVKKGKKQPKNNSFQDHQLSKAKSMTFQKETSYMDTRSMLFDEPNTHQTPPTSPPRCYSPRSPSCSPPASLPSRESSGAQFRGLPTWRQEETPVWTSFHPTPWCWPRTLTWTFSIISWNITISTLQNTVAGQGQGPREN